MSILTSAEQKQREKRAKGEPRCPSNGPLTRRDAKWEGLTLSSVAFRSVTGAVRHSVPHLPICEVHRGSCSLPLTALGEQFMQIPGCLTHQGIQNPCPHLLRRLNEFHTPMYGKTLKVMLASMSYTGTLLVTALGGK